MLLRNRSLCGRLIDDFDVVDLEMGVGKTGIPVAGQDNVGHGDRGTIVIVAVDDIRKVEIDGFPFPVRRIDAADLVDGIGIGRGGKLDPDVDVVFSLVCDLKENVVVIGRQGDVGGGDIKLVFGVGEDNLARTPSINDGGYEDVSADRGVGGVEGGAVGKGLEVWEACVRVVFVHGRIV